MSRLCERPGCSDRASVAYGMRAEHLVFWLDHLTADHDDAGVLCQRHADTMVVPNSWTLDDQRSVNRPDGAAVEPADLPVDVVSTDETSGERAAGGPGEQAGGGPGENWAPTFDHVDDLDGLLSARSPLLARAFRGNDRPRS